jgi:hypothetical protein
MTSALTLADLTSRTGLDVLYHLERQVTVPVTGGLQAQGDLIVIPHRLIGQFVVYGGASRGRDVPADGIELLRSAAGGNPHTLIADPGTGRWDASLIDPTGLGLGVLTATAVAYLIHPEHGATGIAPGTYVIRRQRERGDGLEDSAWDGSRLVAD